MEIQVTECDNCPFCQYNETRSGATCGIDFQLNIKIRYMEEDYSNDHKIITPTWCLLKKESITIQFKEQKDGTD